MSRRDLRRTRPAGRAQLAPPPAVPAGHRRLARTRIRDLGPDDGHVVDAVFAGMSERSRHRRFHRTMPMLPDDIRRVLVDVDGQRHLAIAVEVRRRGTWYPVGMGRIVTDLDGTAELAVSVVDAWHGHGIGTRIVRALLRRARTLGIRELVAEVMADNKPMLQILRRELPTYRAERSGSSLRMICSITQPGELSLTLDDVLPALTAG